MSVGESPEDDRRSDPQVEGAGIGWNRNYRAKMKNGYSDNVRYWARCHLFNGANLLSSQTL